ncbi:MAG: nuclear transport factor 2 family protein [Candidatus Andeanibacterium colombiense]|uniref:Nuclear transport factor 2 family protein n=1 Tax=Candidatus Andeanibacterium colombiense TaxID=3121345 RepID=A0AAJ5X5J0_9SPHN|nr:MAG: nuclear transport factor 2 family protein [Sphingomonadaceae bacterium]
MKAPTVAALLLAAIPAVPLLAQDGALTPQDYIEIQELNAHYALAIDECTNGGYDYADLYTPDGTFGLSEKWGEPGRVAAKGRDALAVAAGGGPQGCRDPKSYIGYGISHIITNQIIEPRPDGAYGRNKLIAMSIGGDPNKNEVQGGYEDHYVKTPQGWRIQSRVHVFPGMKTSLQFGPSRQ